jgi:hypothetical protein
VKNHLPVLQAPWYADPADGTVLHRYLDEEFVPRFLQEAQSGRLVRNADQAWRGEDRFGGRMDYPTLRLPVHRAFYIASCEVSCDAFGLPALDPARIVSAGLVVRRGSSPAQALRWIVKEGVPMGWWGGEAGNDEPCDCRKLRQLGLLPERYPEPAYSGEETAPMHPLLLRTPGANGANRTRTLLWGYVPLGGQVRVDGPVSGGNIPEPDYALENPWPFGHADGEPAWTRGHGYQVRAGKAQPAFRQLLALLLGRYRVNDAADPDNAALRQFLGGIFFHAAPLQVRREKKVFLNDLGNSVSQHLHFFSAIEAADLDDPGDPVLNTDDRRESLLTYIDRRGDQILEWLSWQDRGVDHALPGFDLGTSEPPDSEANLPRLDRSLYLAESEAEALRGLLDMRARAALAASDMGTAMPRFGQDDDDVFFVRPFVRYQDAQDCERIAWGPASQPFRVASPLSPQAQRPSLIALPELADLKRGGPRGVTFMAPKSLADKILKLKMNMDLGTDGPGNRSGACFGFSFSLPVITLVAMILMMVMINLLNILFRWLPFAFLALPRLCLRAVAKAAGGGR